MLSGVLIQTGLAYLFLVSFVCLITAADFAFPREAPMVYRNRLRVIGFAVIFIPCAIVSGFAVMQLLASLGLYALADIPGLLGFVAAVILTDLAYYWYHRAQHSVGWLWRFHSVHHSIEKMGAGAGYHHLLEAPVKALFVSLPVSMVMDRAAAPLVVFLFSIHGYYIHSTTRLNFGPLAWLIADNRVHRIHHSLEPRHFNKNFGALSLIWDKLFGTAYFPTDEWPAVGLSGSPEPRTLAGYISLGQKLGDVEVSDNIVRNRRSS